MGGEPISAADPQKECPESPHGTGTCLPADPDPEQAAGGDRSLGILLAQPPPVPAPDATAMAAPDGKEQARRRAVWAWCFYDWANSGYVTVCMSAILPVYFVKVAGKHLGDGVAATYWAYTSAFSALIAAIVSPVLGMADPPYRW